MTPTPFFVHGRDSVWPWSEACLAMERSRLVHGQKGEAEPLRDESRPSPTFVSPLASLALTDVRDNLPRIFRDRSVIPACMGEEVLIDCPQRKEKLIAVLSGIAPAWAHERTAKDTVSANLQILTVVSSSFAHESFKLNRRQRPVGPWRRFCFHRKDDWL